MFARSWSTLGSMFPSGTISQVSDHFLHSMMTRRSVGFWRGDDARSWQDSAKGFTSEQLLRETEKGGVLGWLVPLGQLGRLHPNDPEQTPLNLQEHPDRSLCRIPMVLSCLHGLIWQRDCGQTLQQWKTSLACHGMHGRGSQPPTLKSTLKRTVCCPRWPPQSGR